MRPVFSLLWFLVSVIRSVAEEETSIAAHRAQIRTVLQEEFKYNGAVGPRSQVATTSSEVVAMKPFAVSVSRDVDSRLAPNVPVKRFDVTKEIKIINHSRLKVGMMKYKSVIPENRGSSPKITLIKIQF